MNKAQLIEKCTKSAEYLQNLLKQYKKETGEYYKVKVYDEEDNFDEKDDEGNLWWYLKPARMKFTYVPTYTMEDLKDILGEIEGYVTEVLNVMELVGFTRMSKEDLKNMSLPKKEKVTRSTDNYIPINKEHVGKINLVAKLISEIQKETGHTEVQWHRHFLDMMTGDAVGCQMINEGLAGWDGKYNEDVLFEAKNNTLDKKGNLDARFDNIGDWKITEMKQGGLGVVTAWETFGNPAFRAIFNTKNVADTVERTLGQKRRSTTVTFGQLFESGAKVVACGMSRRDTLRNIREHYPHINITLDDIYDSKCLKKIAKEFAEM